MPEGIFIGKNRWSVVNGAPVENRTAPFLSPSGLMKDTLWLYSIGQEAVDGHLTTAQCLGTSNTNGRSIRKYAYHARHEINGIFQYERNVEVYVDLNTMLPDKVEVTVKDGKYVDEWTFDPSIKVELPSAAGKTP